MADLVQGSLSSLSVAVPQSEGPFCKGRGTPTPFSLFGAPWLDGPRMVARLNGLGLAGVRFEKATFKPRSID